MKNGKRILVVDDGKGQRILLEAMVENLGHEVELAADGVEALDKLEANFHLVLLDVKMPGMDGFEVLRRIRESEKYGDIRVAMITGYDSPEVRQRAQEEGADDFLAKPIQQRDLERLLRSLFTHDKPHSESVPFHAKEAQRANGKG